MGRATRVLAAASVVLTGVLLAGCTQAPSPTPPPVPTAPVTNAPTAAPTASTPLTPLQPSGAPRTIQAGLRAPWSMLQLPSGSTLVSERDSGLILEILPGGGGIRDVGTVPGVVHAGEGGLLGLAAPKPRYEASDPEFIYAYLTTATDNRVVRMSLSGVPGIYRLGPAEKILTEIPKANVHDGGRIAFGPDGMLYVATGDASGDTNAQNLASLGGKILRLTATGDVPADNPFPGSPVYSYGHRNPQGLAWDSHGTLWASEFGQNTWDELNIITPGANYGWPVVEGIAHNPEYTDPVYQWPTSQASPSGIAIVHDTIFMAGLGGRRLWSIYPSNGGAPVRAVASYADALGRLRDVLAVGDDTLWLLTNNTDGRGTPRSGDDRIAAVRLSPLPSR